MSEPEEKMITPLEAFDQMQEGLGVYLDVRTQGEFSVSSPQNSINVPVMNQIDGSMVINESFVSQVKEKLSLDQKMFVGCKTGGRSLKACKLLSAAGFQGVSNVTGGFLGTPYTLGWVALDLPIQP